MNKSKPVALIAAGKLTDSPLSRFQGLAERLGPIKSLSFRLASRIANSLRAGYAVKEYGEISHSRLIMISVPSEITAKIVEELATATIAWRGKAVVLCSTSLDSSHLSALSAKGAAIASIAQISGLEDLWYLVEGDKRAVRELRYVVEHRGRRIMPIDPGCKQFYLSSLTCTGSLLFAVLFAASESLRQAGVSPAVASSMLEKQMNRTLRSYLKAGRKAYPSPARLPSADSAVNEFINESARLSNQLMEKRW